MTEQIVITEKSSQARDVRAAVGSRYGAVLPAEGHLLDLCEPEDANPAWKRWSTELLKPEGLYGTKPATGGNKAAKLKAIRAALRTAKRVWLATDCDREGQLIGQEILEHCGYRGEVMRVMFTAQDPKTIRDAFGRARPNAEHAPLYAAAVARRQADQIYNLSLTRTATVTLGRGAQGVIGVGRVKTPTLAIACKRELEIRGFVPVSYFEVAAAAHAGGGAFRMRHVHARLALQDARRPRLRREPQHRAAARQFPNVAEHRRLAGPRPALHAHDTVARQQHRPHRFLLARRQAGARQVRRHLAGAGQRLPRAETRLHRRDHPPLRLQRPVGHVRPVRTPQLRLHQVAVPHHPCHRLADLAERVPPRRMAQRQRLELALREQRSHAELKRSAPAGRPQGGMVYRVGVGLATRASGARCRPGPGDGVPQFSYRHCFCGRGFG